MEWKNIYRGLLMGASDIIPGVSGGTIAVILGIYDRLIAAVNGFFSKEWKRHLGFLVPLGVGMAIAVLLLSHVIKWLFYHYPEPTNFFFLGLIIGVLPYLFHKADARKQFTARHIILLIIGVVLMGALLFLNTAEGSVIENKTGGTYALLFFAGFIASAAMILPGISGSFMLLVIGVYTTVISAISNLQLDIMATVGAGIVVGIVAMSKIINFFLRHYYTGTFAVIIGLVIGSIAVIFPGWPMGVPGITSSVAAFLAGLIAAYILGRVEYE